MQAGLQVGVLFAEGEEVCTVQSRERFAETASGEKSFGKIAAVDDDDVRVASELTMLKAVVEKVNRWKMKCRVFAGGVFREKSGVESASSDKDWHIRAAGDEERFVAE